MAIVYHCGVCGHATAMLTNSMETQMVRSLGVTIGGRTDEVSPMEMLRSSLSETREGLETAMQEKETAASKCPVPNPENAIASLPSNVQSKKKTASKCPFTQVVTEAFEQQNASPEWQSAARDRLASIPEYVRPMVQKGIEDYAREKGYNRIDEAVMDEVKGRFGM